MNLTEELKKKIDAMSYREMLSKRRFAPIGAPIFQGESGDYFSKAMREKGEKLEAGEHSRISKDIGWQK